MKKGDRVVLTTSFSFGLHPKDYNAKTIPVGTTGKILSVSGEMYSMTTDIKAGKGNIILKGLSEDDLRKDK